MATTDNMSTLADVVATMASQVPDLISSVFNDSIANLTSTTSTTTTTPAPAPAVQAVEPTSMYDYDTATFEIILPCIFGIFVTLSLSLVMFYTKYEDYDKSKSQPSGGTSKKGLSKLFQTQFDNTEWENVTNGGLVNQGYSPYSY